MRLLQKRFTASNTLLVNSFKVLFTPVVWIFNDKLFLWIISSKQLNFGLAVFNLVAFPFQIS